MFAKPMILFIKLVTFILFCGAGIWIGFILAGGWVRLEYTGRFTRWQLLNSPERFRQLVGVSRIAAWAQAESGSYYAYQFENCSGAVCDAWVASILASEVDPFTKKLTASGCERTYQFYADDFKTVEPRYPPQDLGTPIQCAVTLDHNPYNGAESLTYFVLLDNGEVWMWRHKADLAREFKLYLAGTFAGMLSGIMVWFPLQKRVSPTAGKL